MFSSCSSFSSLSLSLSFSLIFSLFLPSLVVYSPSFVSSLPQISIDFPPTVDDRSNYYSSTWWTTLSVETNWQPEIHNGEFAKINIVGLPTVQGSGTITRRLLVPNSQGTADGCNPQFANADDGTPYAGNVILLPNKGACDIITKGLTWQAKYNPLYILYPFISESDFIPYAAPAFFPWNYGVTVPVSYMFVRDWNKLYGFLTANRTQQMTISIKGAGVATARTKQFLQQFNTTQFPTFDALFGSVNYGSGISPVQAAKNLQANSAFDPCTTLVWGIFCEDGEIVGLQLSRFGFTGSMLRNFDLVPKLRQLDLLQAGYPAGSVLDASICQLRELAYFDISQGSIGLGGLNCFGSSNMPNLDYFAAYKNPAMTALPSSLQNNRRVRLVSVYGSAIGSLSGFSLAQMGNLSLFDVSGNGMTGPVPSIRLAGRMRIAKMSGNSFSSAAPIGLYDYDSLPLLEVFDLGGSKLPGVMPRFNESRKLLQLDLSHNLIASGFPDWSHMGKLVTLLLTDNQIVAPINSISVLTSLVHVDLSHNRINNQDENLVYDRFIVNFCSSSVQHVDLSDNRLTGDPDSAWINTLPNLQVLYLSNNRITALPDDLYFSPSLKQVDFSSNLLKAGSNLPGTQNLGWPSLPGGQLISLDARNNPLFSPSAASPAAILAGTGYIAQSTSVSLKYSTLSCPQLTTPSLPYFTVLLDPTFYKYYGCSCTSGYYGIPPACQSIPIANSGATQNPQINPFVPLNTSVTVSSVPALSFSDGWYGSSRALVGLDTLWEIDFTNSAAFNGSFVPLNAGNRANLIRALSLRIYVDYSFFGKATEQIDVFQGLATDVSLLKLSLQGLSATSRSQLQFLSAPAVAALPASVRSQISGFTSPAFLDVSVIGPRSVVNFRSRDSSGVHFVAFATGLSACPSGFKLAPLDDSVCIAIVPEYVVTSALRYAMFACSAFVGFLVLVCCSIIAIHRETAVVRASSYSFTVFIGAMLLFMAGSASLYAVDPEPSTKSGDSICHARVWCSAISLMSVLGVLVAKSFRVSVIFGSKVLLQIKSVTDLHVAGVVTGFVSTQLVMLIIFQAQGMTWADLLSNGKNEVVRGCNTGKGFDAWVGVNIAIFACTMIAGAVVAFKTRSVPSAFNESTHILLSLELLLFFILMIVPIDWALVSSSPEASIVIQAGGQCILCLFLTATTFLPKIYYIYAGRANDKSLLFNPAGSKISMSSMGSKSSSGNSSSNNSSTTGTGSKNGTEDSESGRE
jgi:leucine-rich repeat protein SHOC2